MMAAPTTSAGRSHLEGPLGMTIPSQDFGTRGIKDANRPKGRPPVSGEGPGGNELGDYSLQSRPIEAPAQSSHHA